MFFRFGLEKQRKLTESSEHAQWVRIWSGEKNVSSGSFIKLQSNSVATMSSIFTNSTLIVL